MKGRKLSNALACFAAIALVATAAGNASAALTKADASCRSAIQKNQSKLANTTFKTLAGCFKSALGGKIAATVDCTTVSAQSDAKGKVSGTAGKSSAGITGKCTDAGAPNALAEFASGGGCPSPAS